MVENKSLEKRKWIIVTGGVVSGLGKGVVVSSIGTLLTTQGYTVNAVKIDPYINIDAGTLRPTVHGEVFVTYDGGETDQDLGNYERFMDVKFSRKNNITTGQIYQEVIRKERNLEYHGSDVEVTKHVPQEIIRRLRETSEQSNADFTIIEIGGTVGDYQNIIFLEAVRQMKLEGEKVMFIHVSYLPVLSNVGEMKTKPTQHSVRALNSIGIFADVIVTRGPKAIDAPRKHTISWFCNVPEDHIISAPDMESIYAVPLQFIKEGLGNILCSFFSLTWKETKKLNEWRALVDTIAQAQKSVRIGIVGKYFDIGDCTLEDSYLSVIEALKAAGFSQGIKPSIQWIDSKVFENKPNALEKLKDLDGVIVPGGFGTTGVEGKIAAITVCREQNIPFLGLCYGLQLAVIEMAKNIFSLPKATSQEIDPDSEEPVIAVLPEQEEMLKKKQYGNSMRLGDYPAVLLENSKVATLYGKREVYERHRHRYEVNPAYHDALQGKNLVFSGKSPDGKLVEFIELNDHPYFVATQAHPEFNSRPNRPHPLFSGLIAAAANRRNSKL